MSKHKEATIDTPCSSYAEQFERWEPITHLRGGTLTMRAAGKKYLPQEKGESKPEYDARLNRTVLRGMHNSAVKRLTSRPFSKPIKISAADSLPEQLQGIEDDCDLEGTSLTRFGMQLAQDAWRWGRTHFLVDYPRLDGPQSRAEEIESGRRPYWSFVSALSLIGWRYSTRPNGAVGLDDIRVLSTQFVPVADESRPWDEEIETTVTRYMRVGGENGEPVIVWEKHVKRDSDEDFAVMDGGQMLGMTEIPLVTIYTARTGFMESEPPMEDLAWIDVAHWQSSSDQRNILRYARVPMLYMTGIEHDIKGSPTPIGASRTLKSTNPDAKFGYVEPSGAAIKSGEDDLRHLEEIGEALGSAPMTRRSGNVVATAKAIDEAGVNSDAQAAIRAIELGIKEGYWWSAKWIGADLPEDFAIDVYSEFDLTTGRAEDMKALEYDYGQQLITRETLLRERRRRGVYTESMEPAVEIALAEAEERPTMGMVMPDDGEDEFGAGIDTGGGDDQ